MGRPADEGCLTVAAATMSTVEDQETREERLQRIRERVADRADELRAEMAAAMGRVTARVDNHEERIGALEAKVDAMAPVIRQAYVSEDLPVPDALQAEETAARLQVIPGG